MKHSLRFQKMLENGVPDIAIVGFSGRFPGAASVEQFWNNLRDGVVSITPVPESRWRIGDYYDALKIDNEVSACRGGFIDGVDMFDPVYFRLSDNRAKLLAPQCRVLLEVVAETINHAGYPARALHATNTAVYIGADQGDYGFSDIAAEYIGLDRRLYNDKNGIIGNVYQNMAANLVSKHFNFVGSSFTLSSACSSSFVAIHLACQSLLSGEHDVAVAGAVQLHLSPFPFLCASRVGVLSADGNTRTFSGEASGYALSEGVGAVLLKRLDDAVNDGDSVYGVIKASAVNNDGRTMSVLLANPEAQKRVMRDALARAGISAATIGYLEANGTALPLGDPIEFSAASSVFREFGEAKQYCAIGSIEPNTGHMVAASGMGRLFKVLMALAHKQLPPFIYANDENPKIKFAESPFYTNDRLIHWLPIEGVMRAGINAFGFGGTNCHLIVEAFDPGKFPNYSRSRAPLPDIQFDRKRVWYEENGCVVHRSREPLTASEKIDSELHPLLHYSTSKPREHCFTSHFSGDESFFLDHCVRLDDGRVKALLPGVAYLEMARAAIERSLPEGLTHGQSIRFRDILWIKPLLADTARGGVHVRVVDAAGVRATADGGPYKFEVYSQTSADAAEDPLRAIHAQGRALIAPSMARTVVDLTALRARFGEVVLAPEQCYRAFTALGLQYGPAYQGIESVLVDRGNAVLANIALPEGIASTDNRYVLHPSLLDAVLQCAICLMVDVEHIGSNADVAPPPLPFAIESFESDAQLPTRLLVWVRYAADAQYSSDGVTRPVHKIDIDAYDDQGGCRLTVRGFSAKAPGAEQVRHVATAVDTQRVVGTGTRSDFAEQVLSYLKEVFAPLLKVPADALAADAPLERYDIDSAVIIEINNRLETLFGNLSKTLLFEYQTLDELADYFARNHGDILRKLTGAVPTERVTAAVIAPTSSMTSCETVRSVSRPLRIQTTEAYRAVPDFGTGALVEPIAIIGLSGKYPQAETLEAYWDNLVNGKECFTEIPEERWYLDGFYHPDPDTAVELGMSYCKWGAFLDGFAEFDPLFFGISPREAMNIDPQERLFLQACWAALEDSGYTRKVLGQRYGKRVGVFAGITKTGFDLYGPELWRRGDRLFPRSSFPSVANRVSYFFNLHGPSYPIDTMCSSSLTAIHEASEHLRRGECELALVGGVNLYLHPANYVALSSGYMLSRDGHCRSFGKGSNGFVPGEGVGVVVLKRLSAAIDDGDRIHAVVKASSVNHGGKTNGYTVPNPRAQAELIRMAIDRAGIGAERISYIEAHGTGTELGDPIEFAGLVQAFRQDTQRPGFCWLGSVKSNIGHLEAAAGMAGLTKVILQMKHRTLVPSINSQELNPNIQVEHSPFIVVQETREWGQGEAPRIAGISAFGSGGANAHVLIEEYAEPASVEAFNVPCRSVPILLSAQDPERLRATVTNFLDYVRKGLLQNRPGVLNRQRPELSDVAYTLQVGREHLEHRIGIIADSLQALAELLVAYLKQDERDVRIFEGSTRRSEGFKRQFYADNDAPHLLDAWLENKKFPELLSAWINGVEVDWRKLYSRAPVPAIVSLPTYPFKKQLYWFDSNRLTGVNPRASSLPQVQVAESGPVIVSGVAHVDEYATTPGAPALVTHKGDLDGYLSGLIGKHLKVPDDVIEFDRELQEYGLDSIVSTQILNDLVKTFPGVPRSLFLEHTTLNSIKQYLHKEHALQVSEPVVWDHGGAETTPASHPGSAEETEDIAEPVSTSQGFADPAARVRCDVSIIGMSAILPHAETMEQFWNRLKNGDHLVQTFPERRVELIGQRLGEADAAALRQQVGGFVDGIEYFDHECFRLSLDEARELDPQLRKLLEVAWQSIENAGYTLRDFRNHRTGVFVALNKPSGYAQLAMEAANGLTTGFHAAELLSVYANRISNVLNLIGPSRAIETGCSSFLIALKEAMDALNMRRCDQAIVATAELSVVPDGFSKSDTLGLYSRQNATRSFSTRSDGYVKSETIGAVVLKRADDAQRAGDAVYANIKGIGACHGGKAPIKWYSPNVKGQKCAIEEALSQARIDPTTISYIEPEANGSQLGDASEIIAIQSAYKAHRAERQGEAGDRIQYIGSMKPQTGHAEAASTLPVLIKLIWSMKHATMLGTEGIGDLNEGIKLHPGFELLQGARPWLRLYQGERVVPRRGAIHSMSIGGVNAHLILEEPQYDDARVQATPSAQLFIFSGRSINLLRQSVKRYLDFLKHECLPDCDPQQLAYTLQSGREQGSTRLAVVASGIEVLIHKLGAWYERGESDGVSVFASQAPTEATDPPPLDVADSGSDLLNEQVLVPLARKWVAGGAIDWCRMYAGRRVRRLNVPASALQRVFCWVPGIEEPSVQEQHDDKALPASPFGVLKLRPCWRPKPAESSNSDSTAGTLAEKLVFCDWTPSSLTEIHAALQDSTDVTVLKCDDTSPARQFMFYAKELFEIVKGVLVSKPVEPVRLQLVLPNVTDKVYLLGLGALLKTVGQESNKLKGQLISVEEFIPPRPMIDILHENLTLIHDVVVKYDNGERFVQQWDEIDALKMMNPATGADDSIFKDNGVYLITGGLGGLGAIVAEEIVRKTRHATIVMTGRSALSDARTRKMHELKAHGATVVYYRSDVTQRDDVESLIGAIVQEHGHLDGIIHAAGIVHDSYIINKSLDELARVMNPKVDGLYLLDEATKDLDLDFMFLFSSVSGVYGNVGQADYAMGNAFMDFYTLYRNELASKSGRRGKTLSFNWPLWADGGMDVPASVKDFLRRKMYVVPMPTEDGLEVLNQSAYDGGSQWLIHYGDVRRMRERLRN